MSLWSIGHGDRNGRRKGSGLASPSKFYSYRGVMLYRVIFIGPQIMDIAKEISENDIGYTVGNGCIEQFIHAVEDFRSARQIDKIEMSQRARYLFDEKYKSCDGINTVY